MKIELAKYDGVFDEDRIPLKLDKLKTYTSKKDNPKNQYLPLPPKSKMVREPQTFTGLTKEGYTVGFDGCSKCHHRAEWCSCPGGITPPSIVTYCDNTLVISPKV
jgi:hypothetical protein